MYVQDRKELKRGPISLKVIQTSFNKCMIAEE